uniref:Uncharacterized protein n=1 Tax=Anopheles atroparvus TaxID=41427 RepID=A0AAG5DFY3_ANOAO
MCPFLACIGVSALRRPCNRWGVPLAFTLLQILTWETTKYQRTRSPRLRSTQPYSAVACAFEQPSRRSSGSPAQNHPTVPAFLRSN